MEECDEEATGDGVTTARRDHGGVCINAHLIGITLPHHPASSSWTSPGSEKSVILIQSEASIEQWPGDTIYQSQHILLSQ